mgnify:CR=1 FL=1|jgi:hypothetical protein
MGAYARASKDSINGSHPPADWSKAHDRGSINRPDESFRSLVVRKLTLLQLPVADAGGSASQASIYTQRYRCGRTANSRKTDIFVRGDKSAGRPLSSSSGSRTRKGNCNALPTFAPTQRVWKRGRIDCMWGPGKIRRREKSQPGPFLPFISQRLLARRARFLRHRGWLGLT